MNNVIKEIGRAGLVPMIKISNARDAVPLAKALLQGGLPVVEITYRTSAAADSIREIAAEIPGLLLGAGTVLTVEQARQAVEAGARYIVSPGFSPKIVDWCLENDVPVTPGVATPTDVMMALDRGLDVLKFFPADELGGPRYLAALAGPFPEVQFIPTGDIDPARLPDYLAVPNVFAVAGSWMATNQLIAAGEFGEITRLATEAVRQVRQARRKAK